MPSVLDKNDKKGSGKHTDQPRSRRVARWLLEFVVTTAFIWVVFAMAGRALPKIALKQISELTNTQINAESVDFRFDGSVFIKHLVIRPHGQAGYDNSILRADTVSVHFRLGSLLKLSPRLREIYVDDFVLRAQYDSDKRQWNLEAMKFAIQQGMSGRLPLIWLENGTVEYSKVSRGFVRVVSSTPVSAGFRPAQRIVGGYSFDISSAGRQRLDKSAIFGYWQRGRIVVGGRLSSKDLPGFERPWIVKSIDAELTYDPNQSCVLTAKIKDLTGPPSEMRNLFSFDTNALADKLPIVDVLQSFFNQYGPSGKVDIDLQVTGNLKRAGESKIAGRVYCDDAAISARDFPYAMEHIKGQIGLTEKSASLKGLKGRHGQVELAIDGEVNDFGSDWKYDLQISSDNMLLDSDLFNALTPDQQKLWSAFTPTGTVGINYAQKRTTPKHHQSSIIVRLLGVDSRYAGFSYPLKNASGQLFLSRDEVVFSDAVSQWDGRRITVNGKAGPGEGGGPRYDFEVKAENIPLDSTLAEALPAPQREFYNQFEMSGHVDATIKVSNPTGKPGAGTFLADVFPKGGSVKARILPISIDDLTGKIVFKPEVVDIENLGGRYGEGKVGLSGSVWPAEGEGEMRYCLSMRAEKVELNQELVTALPGPLSQLVGYLRPAGQVSLTADMSKNGGPDCPDNRLVIECMGNKIECNFMPYPLQDISGRIVITQSQIELEDVEARASHIIRGTPVESLMRMTGRIILGEAPGAAEGSQITAGDVNFYGRNVRFKSKSLAEVDTVLVYDPQSGQWLSRYFVADFYEGKMIGKLQLNRSGAGGLDYLLEASVAGADLKKFLSDTDKEGNPDEQYSSGSINGSLSVVGSIVDGDIRLGRCRLKIIDMQVGKLSPISKLLQVLNLTEPSDYAFDQMMVDAYIQDNRMYFRQIDLSGKSLAFYGSGWLDLKTNVIDLTLTARGHRLIPTSPSILQSLTEGLSRAVIRVEVKGNAADPQVTTMPLPVIKETLEILGAPRDN